MVVVQPHARPAVEHLGRPGRHPRAARRCVAAVLLRVAPGPGGHDPAGLPRRPRIQRVLLPAIVAQDGFVLSHTQMVVDLPEQDAGGPLPPAARSAASPGPRASAHLRRHDVAARHGEAARQSSKRPWIWCRPCSRRRWTSSRTSLAGVPTARSPPSTTDDADTVLVACNTMARTRAGGLKSRRAAGEKVGLVKVKLFRPFLSDEFVQAIGSAPPRRRPRSQPLARVRRDLLDRGRRPACARAPTSLLQDYIVGLGGGDVTPADIDGIVDDLRQRGDRRCARLHPGGGGMNTAAPAVTHRSRDDALWRAGNGTCAGCGMSLGLQWLDEALDEERPHLVIPACCASVTPGSLPATAYGVPDGRHHLRRLGRRGHRRQPDRQAQRRDRADGLLGRRRRHLRHRHGDPVGGRGAQRGHHLRLLRQRDLRQHRRPAQQRHDAGRQDHHHAGRARLEPKKDIMAIMAAHRVPYAATLSLAPSRRLHAQDARPPDGLRASASLSCSRRARPAGSPTRRGGSSWCAWPSAAACSRCTRSSTACAIASTRDRTARRLTDYMSGQGRFKSKTIDVDAVAAGIAEQQAHLEALEKAFPGPRGRVTATLSPVSLAKSLREAHVHRGPLCRTASHTNGAGGPRVARAS